MQREICHVIHVLGDDPTEGVYCGFCIQNSPDCFMLLGKLADGDDFTEQCRQALLTYAL